MRMLPTAVLAATLAGLSPWVHGADPEPAQVDAPQNAPSSAAPAAPAAPGPAAVAAPDALIKRGKLLFLQCAACHSVQADVQTGIGPNLCGVVGRAAASLPGFHYSPALSKAGLTWNETTLDAWIKNPNALAPGTYMIFAGIPKAADRQAVIAYLQAATAPR